MPTAFAFSTQYEDAILVEANDYSNPDVPWFFGPTEHAFCFQISGATVIADAWAWFGKQEHELMRLQGNPYERDMTPDQTLIRLNRAIRRCVSEIRLVRQNWLDVCSPSRGNCDGRTMFPQRRFQLCTEVFFPGGICAPRMSLIESTDAPSGTMAEKSYQINSEYEFVHLKSGEILIPDQRYDDERKKLDRRQGK